jgi:hypothetical protein
LREYVVVVEPRNTLLAPARFYKSAMVAAVERRCGNRMDLTMEANKNVV